MNDLQKPDDEHFFFRQEMRCKARLEGRFYRAVSTAFEVVSDFGHSLGRPLGWMGVVMALPLPGYAVMLREAGEPVVSALARVAGLSIANTFAFFGFRRAYFGEVFPKVDALTAFIAGTQTVLDFALLFFLGLGLRNRFRLK